MQAQTPVFDVLTRANGLPSDYVFGLDQDARGFLWLATDAGVARYDGRTVRTWTTSDGLPSNLVYTVRAAPDGAIWAGTYEGAARRTTGGFESVLTGEAVHRFHTDAFGRVYLLGQGLYVWERERLRVLYPNILQVPITYAPFQRSFWVSSADGRRIDVLPRPDSVVLRVQPRGAATPGSRRDTSWQFRNENGTLSVYSPSSPAARASIPSSRALLAIPFRQDWIVSTLSDGVFRWDGTALAPFLTSAQLGQHSAYALHQDYEGGLWLGLFGGGAWRLSGLHLTLPGRTDARLAGPIVHLSRDRAGLHASTTSGIYRLDDRMRVVQTYPAARIGRITHARDGTPFVTSNIYLLDASGSRKMTESSWFSSAQMDRGDTLWLGTYGSGIRRMANGRELPALRLPHDVKVVEDLALAADGAMWALTRSHGALRYRNGRWTAFGRREGLPSDAVFSLFDAPGDALWLGTDLGLVRVRSHGTGRDVRVFDDRGRLRGQRLHAVAAVGDTVWALGDRTAYAVVGDLMRAFDAAPLLPASNLVVHDAEILPETRRAVLATSGGLVEVDLTRLDVPLPPPRLALLQIDGREVDDAPDTLRLERGARGVALTFAPLTFASPAHARLQTRADDGPWSAPALDRTVSLAALTDGWHRLDVRAVNVAGTPSDAPLVLHLYVPAPWWRTLWARALWLLLLVGGVVAATRAVATMRRRRQERERAQTRRVQDERDRIARELHDHVGAQLSGVLAGLQLIGPGKAPDEDLVPALRDEVRQTIGALRTTLWTLQHPPSTAHDLGVHLHRYVRDQARLYPNLALSAEAADLPGTPLPPLAALHLFRIGQEALRNALAHAHATHIRVSLRDDDGTLTLRVDDDGTFQAPTGFGQGLESMQARADEIGATFHLDTSDGTSVRVVWTSPKRTIPSGPGAS